MKETNDEWNERMNRETDRKYRWGLVLGYGLIALGVILSMLQAFR